MDERVELLSQPINYAVVHLLSRKFPGVVIQGDTLKIFSHSLKRMLELLTAGQVDELAVEIEQMRNQISEAIVHYEYVCEQQGIGLPYSR